MRKNLPFREKTELFLVNEDGSIVAEDHKSYIMFPGGGIDNNEDRVKSAIRELEEETIYTVDGILIPICTVSWVWFPEWANNEKRKSRYAEYQGERVHIYIGRAKKKNTLEHGISEDTWKYHEGITPEKCLNLLLEYALKDHQNTYPYRIAQYSALRAACILSNIPIVNITNDIRN